MRIKLIIAVILFALPQALSADERSIELWFRLALEDDFFLKLHFDGKQIELEKRGEERETIVPDARSLKNLKKTIEALDLSSWKGVWASPDVLDGISVFATVNDGAGESSTFFGINGCPPGFADLTAAIDAAAGRFTGSGLWKRFEATSIRSKELERVLNPVPCEKEDTGE